MHRSSRRPVTTGSQGSSLCQDASQHAITLLPRDFLAQATNYYLHLHFGPYHPDPGWLSYTSILSADSAGMRRQHPEQTHVPDVIPVPDSLPTVASGTSAAASSLSSNPSLGRDGQLLYHVLTFHCGPDLQHVPCTCRDPSMRLKQHPPQRSGHPAHAPPNVLLQHKS